MSYLALLFCHDEKTARTITQVLNELEFQVEPSSEAFAAVKKLTTQAFDAVVVDCQSEENASLLLKAARNSASNQASLMVALVEGQAGVAAAFRIGANLVLTKPIAVEQARSTLRVARGLLRKNAGATPAVAAAVPAASPVLSAPSFSPLVRPPVAIPVTPPVSVAPPAPMPPVAAAPSRLPVPAAPSIARPVMPPPMSAPRIPVSPSALRAVAASASLETEAEQQPAPDAASAGLLEALDFKTFEAAPDRSFGLSAPESVSVAEVTTGANEAVRSALAPKAPLSSQEFGSFGSAAATAPAKELPKAPRADRSAEVADLFEPPVFGQATRPATVAPVAIETAPYSADLDLTGGPTASRSKAPMLAIVALVAVAGALYFGWSQLHKPTAASTATTGPLQPPPPDFGSGEAAPAPAASHPVAATPVPDSGQAPAEVVNRFARPAKTPAAEQVAPDQVTTPVAVVPSRTNGRASNAAPIEVKTETRRPQSAPQEMAEAPSIATLGSTSQPEALNTIAHATTAVPAAPSSQRISQGVSDGLLIKRVQPLYPQQALQMHTQGKVALQATIAKDGSVRNVRVVSGPAVLGRAASEAVRQWKYRPYTLNGEPIEVQTEININFVPPR
jgi:protein TonB